MWSAEKAEQFRANRRAVVIGVIDDLTSDVNSMLLRDEEKTNSIMPKTSYILSTSITSVFLQRRFPLLRTRRFQI